MEQLSPKTVNHARAQPRLMRSETAALKASLRKAKARIKKLQHTITKIGNAPLDKVELKLLSLIAESHIDEAFEVNFAEIMGLSKPSLDYYLRRLFDHRCIEVVFDDRELGENFTVTQVGRDILHKRRLL